MPDNKHHWETVYNTKSSDAVSWYQAHADRSLQLIQATGLGPQAKVIDVGGGASTLVDDLLTHGYQDVTVMDLSASALAVARARQAPMEARVQWLVADVTTAELPVHAFDVWHDRAVFHFLTTDEQRERYVAQVVHALRPGGFAIVGTFGPQGPEKCSGLAVSRYAPQELHGKFGVPFELIESHTEIHTTPWGAPQQFVYCFCRHHAQ